ncbi:hypothetical protein F5883DRAFT_635901 [Diaporthe sp. PMI_573]|nr:hypothetical protein F5883DRAFT_635901 [Diaporthaceae sp. PMI_573]
MFVKTFFSVAASIIMLGAQVEGATIPESTDNTDVFVPPRVGIAVNPVYACNCPNNCSYKAGHSCKYIAGASSSNVVGGKCGMKDGTLQCL